MTTKKQMEKLIREKKYDPALTMPIIELIEQSIEKRQPLLLDGQAGSGKTAAVYFVAYQKNIKVRI